RHQPIYLAANNRLQFRDDEQVMAGRLLSQRRQSQACRFNQMSPDRRAQFVRQRYVLRSRHQLYQVALRATLGGRRFPNREKVDSRMVNARKFAMAAAIPLREDYDAGLLRGLAKQ